MTKLIRRDDPFAQLFDLRRDFDEMFRRFSTGWPWAERLERATSFAPAIEAWIDRKENKYHLRAEMPAVDPNKVELCVQGNTLTLSAERKAQEEKKEADYLDQEFAYGCFERTIMLPEGVDADKLTAEYKDGVLDIVAPVAATAMPRKIEITALPKAKGAGA
jgi:HSP20 family protein